MIRMDSLIKTYEKHGKAVKALDGVTMHIEQGEFVAFRGPSGSGKTTLLLSVGGLLSPTSGTVVVDGFEPYVHPQDARANWRAQNVGFVFQQFHLVPYLSVLDNILTPSIATHDKDARAKALELAGRFGLLDRKDHVPSELSTGERQRTALARALLNGPKLLLADEPTGNLDEENAQIVLGHLADFAGDGGTVLLVTHDSRAACCARRVIELRDGKIG